MENLQKHNLNEVLNHLPEIESISIGDLVGIFYYLDDRSNDLIKKYAIVTHIHSWSKYEKRINVLDVSINKQFTMIANFITLESKRERNIETN